MKKVFLDDLPKKQGWGANKDKDCIDWMNSIGNTVKFIYNEIEGELQIITYDKSKRKLNIKYNNNIFIINIDTLLYCKLSELLGKVTKQYKYNIGEIIETKTGKIQILNQIRMPHKKGSQKGYCYKCLIDFNIDKITESNLYNGQQGCNVCSNPSQKVLKGVNDLWTTHPKTAKLLKYPEQGYELSFGSAKLEIFICLDCGYEKSYYIDTAIRYGISCPRCSDGLSYPNKFIRAFLDQVNEEYTPEYSPDWAFIEHNNPKIEGKKKYDNLLFNRNEIWEIHGLQHYKESFQKISKKVKTLQEEQENDQLKKELVEQNRLKYIVVDARYSDIEYIKNSLLNLPEIKRYDLSKVDWLKCHEFTCSNLVKVACDYWSNGIESVLEISKVMKLNRFTILKYLKQGTQLNWCNYNPKDAMRQSGKNNSIYKKRTIIQLSLAKEYIKEWSSIKEAEKELNLYSISTVCSGKRNHAGGFKWMYKEDYEKYIEQQNKTNPQDCQEQSFSIL